MKKYLALLALLPGTALAKKVPPAPEPVGAASKAVTNEIVDAIAEEMNRDTKLLVIPGQPRPYSISYKITEVDVNNVSAALGQTESKQNRHFVNLEARVRVGSEDFDNGNFVVAEAPEIDGTSAINLPLEATPRIAKRAAWLVTDGAYKEALIQLRAKLEARKAGGSTGAPDVPAWTKEKPVVSDAPVLVPPLEGLDELEARAKTLSLAFRDQPVLRDSHVALTSYLERRWYLTTEGTSVTDTRRASGVVIATSGQAEDGQFVHDYFLRYGHTAKDLPSDKELAEQSKRLIASIVAQTKAPIVTHYSGPILFEGEGAVGVVRNTLAPHLGGTPVPEGLSPQDAKQFGGQLAGEIGERVMSASLTVIDDPTASEVDGKALIGGYKIDDEGVPAQRVEVVKNGFLEAYLTSRTPSAKGQTSNGHARRPGDGTGGAFHGSATNLILSGRGATSRKALEQRLVGSARAEGKKFGLIIRRFDDAAITGAPDFTRHELVQMLKASDQELPPPVTLAYRLYPDGKQELVRGVQLAEIPIKAWKDVSGVGNDPMVYNFLAATESQLQLRLTGGTDDGFVPSSGVESSITTPDLLFKDLDCEPSTLGRRTLPPVSKPTTK
ncbi:MAG: metallopeptidase TldD-related protein [Kofleriaceae bacterium]